MIDDKKYLEVIPSDDKSFIVPTGKEEKGLLLSPATEWQTITEAIINELLENDIPDKVINAVEYLVCGWSLYKTAQRIGASTPTVRGWLEKYPSVAMAIAKGRRELHKWRFAQLEKQFILALEISQKILDTEDFQIIDGEVVERKPNVKLLAVKARQARFILDLFAGRKLDIRIDTPAESKPPLRVGPDAIELLAELLKGNIDTGKPIETTIRVIDEKTIAQPMLDEKGDPLFGELGKIDTDEQGSLCHICGKRTPNLWRHVPITHKIKVTDYEVLYMLPPGTLRESYESK